MANASKGRSKKKTHTPQVRTNSQLTDAERLKATKKVQKRVAEVRPFKSAWFFIPLLAALVVSPALWAFMMVIGVLAILIGLCLNKNDKMRGQVIAAGVGAILGSLPWFIYEVLGWTGIIG